MCNLLWFYCACLSLLPLTLANNSISNDTTSNTELNTEMSPSPSGSSVNQSHLLAPTAEKLIRFRRHPPFKLHSSHKRSKQRRRIKSPASKLRYGPPKYTPGPTISYFKPSYSSAAHIEEPSFSIDDFHFNGADFKIPASSYEAQSMELNLYGHNDEDLYDAHKFPSLEYSLSNHDHDVPDFSSTYEHVPHQKYGVPPFHQSIASSSYDSHESFAPHDYEPSIPAPAPPAPSYDPPAIKYGVPPPSTGHLPSYTKSAAPPAPDSYSIYEQKIPNAGYQNFAEPPKTSISHNSNYEISYSPPAYEINTSYQTNEHSFEPPAPIDHGDFAEPPSPADHNLQHSPPQYSPPEVPPPHYSAPEQPPPSQYAPPQYAPPYLQHAPPSHAPPPQYAAPHQPPAQHPPSQYAPPQHPPAQQPPAQHSPPQYAPPQYAPPQHSPPQYSPPQHQPPQHPPPPPPRPPPAQHPGNSYAPPETHLPEPNYPHENYASPADDLPINQNHKLPSLDFPKSSYEVPIYDPIPFEASNKEELESYPPILPIGNSANEQPTDPHSASSSYSFTKSRKRKRRPSAAVISKKHTLDVPELQKAYDEDSHVFVRGADLQTAAHGTHYVEQKRKYVNYVTPIKMTATATTTTTTPAPWSPMRMRTTAPSVGFLPTVLTSTPPSRTTSRTRYRGASRYRLSSSKPTTEAAPTASAGVSVQKSRSQSYYDGTVAPAIYQQYAVQAGTRATRPTRPAQMRGVAALQHGTERNPPALKRTTKGVFFDTTLFKSPQGDREIERKLNVLRQNLPKNHKLY